VRSGSVVTVDWLLRPPFCADSSLALSSDICKKDTEVPSGARQKLALLALAIVVNPAFSYGQTRATLDASFGAGGRPFRCFVRNSRHQ